MQAPSLYGIAGNLGANTPLGPIILSLGHGAR
jgi:hypothetical protein